MLTEKLKNAGLFFLGIKRKEVYPDYRPTVTILIPAYNEEMIIGQTILNMRQQTYPITEIIVADDASSDWTGDIGRAMDTTVVRTPKNTGAKSRAQNYALDFVTTDVVVTVDADTSLDPKAIEYILPALADGKTLSACGFVIPQVVETFWEKARLVEYLYGIGLFKKAQEHVSMPIVSSGCFSAFNVKLLNEIGRFPEGNIAEDMALTWKAHIAGYKIKFVPEAISFPKDPSNWPQFRGQVLRWYRGFFQCISMVKGDFLKNLKLSAFIFFYLIMGMLAIVFLGLFAYFFVTGLIFNSALGITSLSLALFFSIEIAIGITVVAINGKRCGCLKKAVMYYPYLWIISFVNSGLFFYALYEEWIRGKKLDVWEKGH
jgi:biofilm PGA synthesis N-glycosyltransferase PgaC